LLPAGITVPERGVPPSMTNFSMRESVGKLGSRGRGRVSKAICHEVRSAGRIPCRVDATEP
jgi:hypothetical protein